MLWPIIHTQFTDEHLIKLDQLDETNSAMDLDTFIPQLIRLNHAGIPTKLAAQPTASENIHQIKTSDDSKR